jgi:hypothetical protein
MEYEKIIAELLTIPGVLGLPDQGDYFEAALVHTHYQYLEERRGLIVKLGVPIRGTGRGSRRAFHGSKTLCDFVGWVLNSVYTHDDELIVRPAYPTVAGDATVLEAVAASYDMPVESFGRHKVSRPETGQILIREEAVYG